MSAPTLTSESKRRYARQILLPEIGESGQLRLLAARARPSAAADPRAVTVASDYLVRAGVTVEPAQPASSVAALELTLPDPAGVRALAGAPGFEAAATTFAGAFAAVEALKRALGVGEEAQLPHALTMAGRPLP